jgi:DNA invertase Pin-like site-specific DNA recombinase
MSLMKTVGYARVSTDKQADRGVSLDAQAEKIRAMAVVHNAEQVSSSCSLGVITTLEFVENHLS